MFWHSHLDVRGQISYDYFYTAILLRRLYRHGAYDEEGVTCHVLASVMAESHCSYEVVHGGVWASDGSQRPQHSWISIKDTEWIIDVKPVHCVTLSPLLLYLGGDSIFRQVYEEHYNDALKKVVESKNTRTSINRLHVIIQRITSLEPIEHEEVLAVMDGHIK